ncbi:MAG: penicillin-binding protein 1C [Helicobacteraceae bacterium]|nr:penicillin-binding protein 1C [Helicobacteraceae bacterium]
MLRISKKTLFKNSGIFLKISLFLFFIFLIYFCFIFFSFNPKGDPFSSRYGKSMFDRNDEVLSIFLNKDEQWHIKNSTEISPKLSIATLAFEDRDFYSHIGINFGAILRSIYINVKYNKCVGGSTITMQTIKLLFQNKRTYFNKINEMILSLRLESLYSKDEILEMYFNNAPYGGNIIGIAAASLLYFQKNPKDLTWGESALLAVLPHSPGLINVSKNSHLLLKKRNRLLDELHKRGHIDEDNLKLAKKENLPLINRSKNLAPHLAFRFENHVIKTTLDKNIQILLENRLKLYHKKLLNLGIQNVAGMILDTKSREVLAYGASQDFLDIDGFGQIDGILAKRSPGSVLKPLLYALAIDNGIIVPQSKLVDAPTLFSNFKPRNASKKYFGLISAKDSLIKSLNVPFVSLLQEYGYDKFFFNLKEILRFGDNNFERYGLSLILGTKEISIEDVAKLYAGFGNYGEFGDIYYTRDDKRIDSTKQIFSKGSAYLMLDALKNVERVGIDNYFINKKIFYWKSGTSYGRKDAWAAGTSPKYTIVVWAGNFNGDSNPNLFGVDTAGALLFDIVNDLGNVGGEFEKSDDLKEILLDLPTGYRYDVDYKDIESTKALYPKSAKPLRKSPFLVNVFLNDDLQEVNSLHKDFINAKEITKIDLPLSLLEYYKEQNVNIKKEGKGLQILYPKDNLSIIRTKDFGGKNELIARIANINNNNVFWYLDKRYLGVSKNNTMILNLDSGYHTLSVIDSNGDSHSVNFTISK